MPKQKDHILHITAEVQFNFAINNYVFQPTEDFLFYLSQSLFPQLKLIHFAFLQSQAF